MGTTTLRSLKLSANVAGICVFGRIRASGGDKGALASPPLSGPKTFGTYICQSDYNYVSFNVMFYVMR